MFHCLVIKVCCVCLSDSSFILSHLKSFVKYFFQLFSNSFLMNLCLADSLFTLSHPQAFVNKFFHFFEKFIFFKKTTEKEGFEPSRRVNDLLPFQGSPFGQLGYFSKLPYLLSSSDIYLCRSQRQVILYLVSFMLSSTFLTFLKSFYSVFDKRREWDSNPRALADKRFSRPPRYDHFDISPYNVFQHFLCCFVSACCILSSNISPVNNKFDIFFKKLDI